MRNWKEIADAKTSDDIILALKYMLHDEFDAEYVIVYISPENISRKIETSFSLKVEFVAREDVEIPEPVHEDIVEEKKRFIPAERVTEEVIKKFIDLGGLPASGLHSIVKNIYTGDTYLGFIALYRERPFTSAERRKLSLLKPQITIILRMANYLALLEDFDTYFVEHVLNTLSRKYNLTPSELYILKSILRGKLLKEIAAERGTSIHAVKKLMKSIYKKMNISTRAELLAKLLPRE